MSSKSLHIATNLTLPAVTVCSNSFINRKSVRQNYPNNYDDILQYLIPLMSNKIRLSEVPLKFIAFLKEHKSIDFYIRSAAIRTFSKCYIANNEVNCSDYLSYIMTNKGICITFNSEETVKTKGPVVAWLPGPDDGFSFILNVEQQEDEFPFSFGSGLRVLVHDPTSYPLMEEHGFAVPPGLEVYARTTKSQVQYLKKPYSERDCVATEQLKDYAKHSFGLKYSPESCAIKCTDDFVKTCNCSFYSFLNDSCSMYDSVTCALPLLRNIPPETQQQICQTCLPLCSATQYRVHLSQMAFPNEAAVSAMDSVLNTSSSSELVQLLRTDYLRLNVYYESMRYSVTQQLPVLGIAELWSRIGGLMGLCLGASLLTLIEWVDFGCTFCIKKLLLAVGLLHHNIVNNKT